jgi:preprotein translocase subunit Sec61beta
MKEIKIPNVILVVSIFVFVIVLCLSFIVGSYAFNL